MRHITAGYGYDISGIDVLDIYEAVMNAANEAGIPEAKIKDDIRALISDNQKSGEFMGRILVHPLNE